VLVDIDHFKSVNDTHGHPAGDAVLQEVARRLTKALRDVDRAARFGGEEFALIIMQADRKIAVEAAERARKAIEATPIALAGGPTLNITVSAGAAELPRDAQTTADLIAAADKGLYAAKGRGRNRVVAFTDV
jgi:diguanylate cyclase (GGDEF)-like protein